jgi:uncharacterized membrane protein
MEKGRLEAFTDGVIAVIITIMVLEIKPPHGSDLEALRSIWQPFVAYVLSFMYVGIYWNNHHHILSIAERIDGRAMWANLFLLFWLSLVPFATAWVGESAGEAIPLALYGALLLMSAVAFSFLTWSLVRCNGNESPLAVALGEDRKGKLSIVLYAIGIAFAFFLPHVAYVLYFGVAMIWFVPDRRVERVIEDDPAARRLATGGD